MLPLDEAQVTAQAVPLFIMKPKVEVMQKTK
jgi:hypothetical protein